MPPHSRVCLCNCAHHHRDCPLQCRHRFDRCPVRCRTDRRCTVWCSRDSAERTRGEFPQPYIVPLGRDSKAVGNQNPTHRSRPDIDRSLHRRPSPDHNRHRRCKPRSGCSHRHGQLSCRPTHRIQTLVCSLRQHTDRFVGHRCGQTHNPTSLCTMCNGSRRKGHCCSSPLSPACNCLLGRSLVHHRPDHSHTLHRLCRRCIDLRCKGPTGSPNCLHNLVYRVLIRKLCWVRSRERRNHCRPNSRDTLGPHTAPRRCFRPSVHNGHWSGMNPPNTAGEQHHRRAQAHSRAIGSSRHTRSRHTGCLDMPHPDSQLYSFQSHIVE